MDTGKQNVLGKITVTQIKVTTGATNTVAISLVSYGTLTGTWGYLVQG